VECMRLEAGGMANM